MGDKYQAALHEAQEELERLEQRRAALLRLIQNLKELSDDDAYELTPPPGYVPQGLTEEIRTILALTTVHLTPPEIRDSLVARGFKASSPKNLLINVHTVLSRLHDARELDEAEKDGKTAFKKRSVDISDTVAAMASGVHPPLRTSSFLARQVASERGTFDPDKLPEQVRASTGIRPLGKLGTHKLTGKRAGDITGNDSAYTSGMRGDEKPKK
ncbi:MAG TPA: hypothetical protein VE377_09440 [Candidatus Dormibacteraeota bacterium]|nr:hypothetical protein [Candidatus Dormibacteraeota bacterium]